MLGKHKASGERVKVLQQCSGEEEGIYSSDSRRHEVARCNCRKAGERDIMQIKDSIRLTLRCIEKTYDSMRAVEDELRLQFFRCSRSCSTATTAIITTRQLTRLANNCQVTPSVDLPLCKNTTNCHTFCAKVFYAADA